MCPLASPSRPPLPHGGAAAAPRSAAAAASPQPSTTHAPPPPSASQPGPTSPGGNPPRHGPVEPARPRLRSLLVGSLELQIDDSAATTTSATAQRRVHFSFTQPPTTSAINSTQLPPPSKSCLKSSAAHGSQRAPPCGNGGAPSQGSSGKTADSGAARVRAPMPGHSSQACSEDDEGGWTEVLRRKRRNGDAQTNSCRPATRSPPLRSTLTEALRGKCFRCLAGGHRADVCREPVRCLRCRRFGHKSRDCKSSPARGASTFSPFASSAPPPPDPSSFPPLPRRAMPAAGDPAARPEVTNAVAAVTPEMEGEATRLSTCAVVLCLCRGHDDPEPEEIERAIRRRFGVQRGDVKVSRHRPENYLAIFEHPHHRDAAVTLERLPVGDLDYRIWPWRIQAYGEHCEMRHRVRLCLEGIPVHAWNESIAKRVVARVCDIDFVERRSTEREDTRALCIWAWTYNPSDIPKVTWLTITGNAVRVHHGVPPPRGRRGLTFRVLIHLDLLEMPPDSHGRSEIRDFIWHYGVIDGERAQRDRHNPPPADNRHERRRDEDNDDERRGRRERRSDHWGSHLIRSLSRAPERAREKERSESRHGRQDNSSTTNGHRRYAQSTLSADAVHDFIDARHGRHGSESPSRRARSTPGERRARSLSPAAGKGGGVEATKAVPQTEGTTSASPSASLHAQDAAPPPIGNNARLHEDTEGASMMTATPPPSAMTAATPPPSPTTPSSTPPEATGNNLQRPASPASGGQDRRELELQRANPSTEPRRRDLVNAQTTPQHGSPAPRTPAAPLPSANHTQVQRFRPGLVYTRRRARGPGGSRAGPSCSPTPSPTTLRTRTSPRSAQAATLPRAEIAATAFVQSLARALPQPLLQAPRRRASSTLRHRKAAAPVRRSVRIAAMSWPRGDAQAKARQVLMKKMGIVEEEGLSAEDLILRYIDLFRGPLTDMTIKAIAALCGLDSAPAASTAQA